MFNIENRLTLIILHALVGLGMVYLRISVTIWFVFAIGSFFVNFFNSNDKNPLIYNALAYILGYEILLRITQSPLPYEGGKYFSILLLLTGIFFNPRTRMPLFAIVYFLLLIPSGLLTDFNDFSYERKILSFYYSGPLTLSLSMFYFFEREISKKELKNMLFFMVLPVISLTVYLFIHADVSSLTFGTTSSFAASGGFGPNQVSTTLGLGMAVLLWGVWNKETITINRLTDVAFFCAITFRGLLTFSRGGVIAPLIALVLSLVLGFFISPYARRQISKTIPYLIIFTLFGIGVFLVTNEITGNALMNRYEGRTARSLRSEKFADERILLAGRDDILMADIMIFLENPILGVGVGMGQLARIRYMGFYASAHTEMTRLIAEHGIFGVVSLIILVFSPIFYFFKSGNKMPPEYLSFFIMFVSLAVITMGHAAMRLAMPGVLYGISFIQWKNTNPLNRKVEKALKDEN